MGKEPDEIRTEIEQTRAHMGETVDAIGYRADVKQRAKDSVSAKKDAVVEKADALVSSVRGATPDAEDVKQGARRSVGIAKENPLGLAIGGAAAGFLAGMLVPSSRVEDEKVGEMADRVKDQAAATGTEALERGKQVAQETAESARETARESAGDQKEELASSLRESAQEVASS